MSLAPLAHVLWTRVMRYDASTPDWPDRDRFVLSAGHASILQYAMLYLTGHGLTLDDLRNFRQWGSATPGHPEVGCTPGVEVTTGPLGQGIANAVGMAIAEAQLRARFGAELCDHRVFVIASDGDLAEGVSHEAASLAGHLGLGRLVVCYDDNSITIDGGTELTQSENTAERFAAYGWHVIELQGDGENLDDLESALRAAAAQTDRPSLLVIRTTIGSPAPESSGTSAAHGYAMFDDEIEATKQQLGLPAGEKFFVPDEVLAHYRSAGANGRQARLDWQQRLESGRHDRAGFETALAGAGLPGWDRQLPQWDPGERLATRVASKAVLNALAETVPAITGGSADLTGSTGTQMASQSVLSASNPAGRQIYFGVREHAMGSIANGMALHGGALPVVGTFLVFLDYMRPAVRLAALSGCKVIFVWSHDSVGVGEDGPTHQPIEHLATLRAMPELRVIRPADATETVGAWRAALGGDGPTAMILTRQSVPVLEGTTPDAVLRGGYVVADTAGPPEVTLVGTGSEVSLCVAAAELLQQRGVAARVVSLPSWELFAEQSADYRAHVIPPGVPSLAVEAAATMGWERWVDDAVGIDRFGASAPGSVVMERLGLSAESVAQRAVALTGAPADHGR